MASFTITTNERKPKKYSKKYKKVVKKINRDNSNYKNEIKGEIKNLEEKKKSIGKGFKGIIQKAAINKEIYNRRNILRNEQKSKNIQTQTKNIKQQIELERARKQLRELKEPSKSVNFNDFGLPSKEKRTLRIEDLY